MSKTVLEILNHFREWENDWKRYDSGVSKERPMKANELADKIAKDYNIKDNE